MKSEDITAAIARFPKEYREMMGGKLSKRQLELLDGADIKSHEGMIFGQMYADWKLRKGYWSETV
jgi:hypothetical protein